MDILVKKTKEKFENFEVVFRTFENLLLRSTTTDKEILVSKSQIGINYFKTRKEAEQY